jgi:hypothetical protein
VRCVDNLPGVRHLRLDHRHLGGEQGCGLGDLLSQQSLGVVRVDRRRQHASTRVRARTTVATTTLTRRGAVRDEVEWPLPTAAEPFPRPVDAGRDLVACCGPTVSGAVAADITTASGCARRAHRAAGAPPGGHPTGRPGQ